MKSFDCGTFNTNQRFTLTSPECEALVTKLYVAVSCFSKELSISSLTRFKDIV